MILLGPHWYRAFRDGGISLDVAGVRRRDVHPGGTEWMTSQSGTDSMWEIITIVLLESAAFFVYFVGLASVFFDLRTPIIDF